MLRAWPSKVAWAGQSFPPSTRPSRSAALPARASGALAAALEDRPAPPSRFCRPRVRHPRTDRRQLSACPGREHQASGARAPSAAPVGADPDRLRRLLGADGRRRRVGLEREARPRRPQGLGCVRSTRIRCLQPRDGRRAADRRSPVLAMGLDRTAEAVRCLRRTHAGGCLALGTSASAIAGFGAFGLGLAGVIPTLFRAGEASRGFQPVPASPSSARSDTSGCSSVPRSSEGSRSSRRSGSRVYSWSSPACSSWRSHRTRSRVAPRLRADPIEQNEQRPDEEIRNLSIEN